MKKYLAVMAAALLLCACAGANSTEKPEVKHPERMVTVHTCAAYPGGFLLLKTGVPADNTTVLRCAFNEKEYEFFRFSDGLVCAVPLLLDEKAGAFPVVVSNDSTVILSDRIIVASRKYPSYALGRLKPLPKNILSVVEKEKRAIKRAFANGSGTPYFLESGGFVSPLAVMEETSEFGTRRIRPNATSRHSGIDLKAPVGTDVRAINDGMVVYAAKNYLEGNLLIVDHGAGIFSVYMHLSALLAKKGDKIKKGRVVAKTGQSGATRGPHLHFGIKLHSVYVDPLALIKALQ